MVNAFSEKGGGGEEMKGGRFGRETVRRVKRLAEKGSAKQV